MVFPVAPQPCIVMREKLNSKSIRVAALLTLLALSFWAVSGYFSAETTATDDRTSVQDNGYVGSDACKDCHEEQFKNFTPTSHARLGTLKSWKNKVTGCEACHGPGKAHIEEGDPAKIISFKNKSSKQISETCLSCHSGREEHNNFRRGEHWRNDVGCTDCHSSHGAVTGRNLASSNTFINRANAEKPDFSTIKLLKIGEPQLCLSCHSEVKHQFTLPSHHKVLEGAIRCSDCHNPHGGFELKQTRLAVGADAACIKCHADKQGPFTFEHAPVKTDGCVACHVPHGSANPRMLKLNTLTLRLARSILSSTAAIQTLHFPVLTRAARIRRN